MQGEIKVQARVVIGGGGGGDVHLSKMIIQFLPDCFCSILAFRMFK